MKSHVSNVNRNYLLPQLDSEARSWTLQRIEAEAADDVDLFGVRSFLFNEYQCTNLFLGDGTSFQGNFGYPRLREYVAPRIYRSQLPSLVTLKL
jgi:hypothetical protein